MYQLKRTQFIPASIEVCWDYFSSPHNLKEITPPSMGFVVRSEVPQKMYEGLMISYTVKPLLGILLNWVTEIKTVKQLEFFVDEQRIGPYKIWHHEHHFKQVDGGVEMTDIVTYVLPFGFLGRCLHPWLVRPKLEHIFSYRFKKVEEIFKN
jgi:ligand-binding SRPBCC domain-containing protein